MKTIFLEENFMNARFATKRDHYTACRSSYGFWRTENGDTFTDKEMAIGGWVPVREADPVTLSTMREAWEGAEVPTVDNPVRPGDTVIREEGAYAFVVCVTQLDGVFSGIRVLTRAPRREKWEDLADLLADMGHVSPTGYAKALHERGVRIVSDRE